IAKRSEMKGNSGHTSKANFGSDICEFESSHPSQPVRSLLFDFLDPARPAALVPLLGRVARLGKAAQNLSLVHGTAHPDIVGGGVDQAVEHNIAGEPENVVDAVVLAPRHPLFAAVMAVAADGDVGAGPVPADAPDQAAEKLANLHTRRRL